MHKMLTTARDGLYRVRHVGVVAMVTLMASPAFADDPTNISNGVTSITTWVKGIAVGLGTLAVMGAGFAKFTGRLDWPRFFSVLVGIGIVFGAPQIVSWLNAGATGL